MDTHVEGRFIGKDGCLGAVPTVISFKMLGTAIKEVGTLLGSAADPAYVEARAIGGNATVTIAGVTTAVASASGWVWLPPVVAIEKVQATAGTANMIIVFRSFGGANGGPHNIAA